MNTSALIDLSSVRFFHAALLLLCPVDPGAVIDFVFCPENFSPVVYSAVNGTDRAVRTGGNLPADICASRSGGGISRSLKPGIFL